MKLKNPTPLPEMRYINQTDQFRCGPVGIANALRWAGVKFNWREMKPLLDTLCNCSTKNDVSKNFNEGFILATNGFLTGSAEPHIPSGDVYSEVAYIFAHAEIEDQAIMVRANKVGTDGLVYSHVFFIPEVNTEDWTACWVNPNGPDSGSQWIHFNYLTRLLSPLPYPLNGSCHRIWFLKKSIEFNHEKVTDAIRRISEMPIKSSGD